MNNAETILLIEDDVSLRALLQEELEVDGYQVLVAGTTAEGISTVLGQGPDLVISDLRLPDGDGLAVLRKLQAEGRVVPFVIITAFGTVDQAVEALQAGADTLQLYTGLVYQGPSLVRRINRRLLDIMARESTEWLRSS